MAVYYGLAYKMLKEIDWDSLNSVLAELLSIPVSQFNKIEASIIKEFSYDVGITKEKFKERFEVINTSCADQHKLDIDKAVKGCNTSELNSSRASSSSSESEMVQKMAEDEKSAGPLEDGDDDDTETASEETKLSSESR